MILLQQYLNKMTIEIYFYPQFPNLMFVVPSIEMELCQNS